ncbi:RES family NAD+ phosphorylase [Pontiellaceae bacterium B12227]|nr:RES family NAD+ phosphorylase [Pontiellaceae bacterium B12227]
MPTAWRIVPPHRVADAFSGEGARLFGGRWNPAGVPVVYVAESKALAALEILVHVDDGALLEEYLCMPVTFDKRLVRSLCVDDLPADWRATPPSMSAQQIGATWARLQHSAVLKVPSVLIPSESNYLINPAHPNVGKLKIGPLQPFEFDPRLLK